MASRKVLGNNPIKRKAAVRVPSAGPPPPKKRKAARRQIQELQGPAAVPAGGPSRSSKPRAEAPSAPFEPVAHPASPSTTTVFLASEPRPHAESPAITADPMQHTTSPSLVSEVCATVEPTSLSGSGSQEGEPASEAPRDSHPAAVALPVGGALAPAACPETAPVPPPPSSPSSTEPKAPPSRDLAGSALAAHAAPPSLGGAIRGLLHAARLLLRPRETARPVDAWGKDAELARSLKPLGELLYERYWRVKTKGIENVPGGSCVLVANHAGALPLDGPILHLALRRERPELADSRWLLEDQVFSAPLIGPLANRLGAVRASPENAHRLLAEGHPLIVFPEGLSGPGKPFSERYQLQRFGRGGYLKVALRAHVPIVPVAIIGSEESSPLLGTLPLRALGFERLPITLPPLPARWQIEFGAPIDLSNAPTDPDADSAWIDETNLLVRERLSAMLAALLETRDGVFE